MDHFPQELIDQVCGYLAHEDLRNAYYVSTKFRTAAEEHAGNHKAYTFSITKENKNQFIKQYSGFQLRYLKEVHYHTHFPILDALVVGCRESIDEQRGKDKIFTEQIHYLFAILKNVEELAGERNRGSYLLKIYSPSQQYSGDYCLHREQAQWRIHLLEPQALPELMSVRSLEIETDYPIVRAKLDYRILIDLITRFPYLESLECHTGVDEWTPSYPAEPASLSNWEYDGPRRDTRHNFGKAVTSTNIPKSLRRVDLDFFCRMAMINSGHIHQWKTMPNLVGPALKDPFSTSLRILSYHLRMMTLRVQADETLFWPEDDTVPTWPNMQYVFIMFHMVSPSGTWYFAGPRGEGRDSAGHEVNEMSYPPLEPDSGDEDFHTDIECEGTRSFQTRNDFSFRISPNNDVLGPFLSSFAKAAINMPELRRAILWTPLRWDIYVGEEDESVEFEYFEPPDTPDPERLAWGIAYDRPEEYQAFASSPGEANCEARQIWWKVGEWRPDAQIHNLFQQIGRQRHGETLMEYWHDETFGHNLVSDRDFVCWTPDS